MFYLVLFVSNKRMALVGVATEHTGIFDFLQSSRCQKQFEFMKKYKR